MRVALVMSMLAFALKIKFIVKINYIFVLTTLFILLVSAAALATSNSNSTILEEFRVLLKTIIIGFKSIFMFIFYL